MVKMLQAWERLEPSDQFQHSTAEVGIAGEIAGEPSKGKADRIDSLPDGSERIVDYKTGRIPSDIAGLADPDTGKAEKPIPTSPAEIQAMLYAQMRTDEGHHVSSVSIVYLGGTGATAEIPVNQENLDHAAGVAEGIRDQIQTITETGEAVAKPGGACSSCSQAGNCQANDE